VNLLRDNSGAIKASSSFVVEDTHGDDFSVSTGDELTVLEVFPDRELAVLQKGEGCFTQTAWVPTRLFNAKEVHETDPFQSETAALRDQEARLASDADSQVELAINAAFAANTHLSRTKSPCTSLYVSLFDGLASSRSDCNSALEATMALVNEAVPGTRFIISVDGQPFGAEQKHRDAQREWHQHEIEKIDLELALQGISADDRQRLERARRAAESKRDSISNLPVVQLGNLHAEFAGVRACFKKNSVFAYSGLADRMGLGHASENMAKCTAGY
jgi:hypothetical protein